VTAITQSLAAIESWAKSVEALSGWTVSAVDAKDDAVRLTFRRPDREIVLDRDAHGRCIVEMSAVERAEKTVGRRGDRARVERVSHRLLWRSRPEGIRSALRIAGDAIGNRELMRPVVNLLAAGGGR